MLHQQGRADGIDGKGPGHLRRIEIAPALFGRKAIALQDSAGIDHQAQVRSERSDMAGGGGDARLVGQVERRCASSSQPQYRVKAGLRREACVQGAADASRRADDDGDAPRRQHIGLRVHVVTLSQRRL